MMKRGIALAMFSTILLLAASVLSVSALPAFQMRPFIAGGNDNEHRVFLPFVSSDVEARPSNNLAPVVDVGADAVVTLPHGLSIDADVSDDGLPGSVLTFTWSQVSGPDGAVFVSPNSEDTNVSFPIAGSYKLRLAASDGELTGDDELVVSVKAAPLDNLAPVVDVGADAAVTLPDGLSIDADVSDDGLPGSVLTFTWSQVSGPRSLASPIFSFGAVGDIGGTENSTAMLTALADSNTDFSIALGDMSYGQIKPYTAWCDYVKSHVGSDYPFELLVGNHEDRSKSRHIDHFAECLPDRLGATGLYAHQYYFDYPAAAPIARFILIDPDLKRNGSTMEYCRDGDTENCDWLKARIAEGKELGLWIIVGTHKNCTTAGTKGCAIGAELQDVLIGDGVDLILQGHEHLYERSKQLSLGNGCETVQPKRYNAECVVDHGADGVYEGGAGTIIVISGAGGKSLRDISTKDPEISYFAAWMGKNIEPSYGFVKFDLAACAIQAQFVAGIGEFDDSFIVTRASDGLVNCEQEASAQAVIHSPNNEDTDVSFPVVGSYQLRLTVSDGELENSDDITVIVETSSSDSEAP